MWPPDYCPGMHLVRPASGGGCQPDGFSVAQIWFYPILVMLDKSLVSTGFSILVGGRAGAETTEKWFICRLSALPSTSSQGTSIGGGTALTGMLLLLITNAQHLSLGWLIPVPNGCNLSAKPRSARL